MNRRLYRSRTDSILGGVAGGVAEYLDIDPSLVRIVWAVLAIVTGGIFFVLYIVMWIVVPEGYPGAPQMPGPGAYPGWTPPSWTPPPGSQPIVPPPPGAPAAPAAPTAPGAEGEAPAGDATAPSGETPPPPAAAAPAWTGSGYPYARHPHRRRGNGGLIFGIILVALGAWFLIDEYVPGIRSDLFWPIGLVVLGVVLLVVSATRRRED
jgi:phage shock protein PspC (stress-responsive transcriptional regulator)